MTGVLDTNGAVQLVSGEGRDIPGLDTSLLNPSP
jgi:hypothetical protein